MQNQNLKCADARHLVHLSVGDDTLADEEKQLSEHLHTCSDCRAYHAGMVDAMQVLEHARNDDSVDIPAGAVWSAISHRVKSQAKAAVAVPERRQFSGSIAALCACSLILALVTIVQNLPTSGQDAAASYGNLPTAMNVGHSTQRNNTAVRRPQLMQVQLENGDVVWMDPATKKVYVPNLLSSPPNEPNNTF